MAKSPLVLLVLAGLLLGTVVPTGATGGDQLWTEPDVVLTPGNGTGAAYATIDADGELEVDLSGPGVNPDADTTFDGVFTVENRESEPVAVWFSHNETDDVVLSVDGRSVQRASDPLVLSSGERASVDLAVDSAGRAAGDLVLSSFTVHAEAVSKANGAGGPSTTVADAGAEPTPTATPDDAGTPASEPATVAGAPAEAEPTPQPPPPSGDDEVVFADGPEPAATFRTLDRTAVGTLDARAGPDGPPQAAIDAAIAPRTLDGGEAVASAAGDEATVRVGQTVALSGHRTVFTTVRAIQPDGRIARLVEVDVPAGRSDEPALVRLTVSRGALGGADPTDARIGRHTGSGWQLLETTVVEADDDRVVLQARTPGFSPFAVFPDPAVRYDWQLPDTLTAGPTVETRLAEPGRYPVTLTVTDGLGRSASTTYHLLANDRPRVTIDAPSTIEPDRPVALHANVTDVVGETTVTWRFEDGTTVVGPSVERSFPAGERVVRVTVVDEYGAATTESVTLVVGDRARTGRAALELVRLGLAIEGRLAVVAAVFLLVLAGLRRTPSRPRRTRRRETR